MKKTPTPAVVGDLNDVREVIGKLNGIVAALLQFCNSEPDLIIPPSVLDRFNFEDGSFELSGCPTIFQRGTRIEIVLARWSYDDVQAYHFYIDLPIEIFTYPRQELSHIFFRMMRWNVCDDIIHGTIRQSHEYSSDYD